MKKIDELIQVLTNLKGIGKKNATRIAFDLLTKEPEEINQILMVIKDSYENIKPCKICFNLTEHEICDICSNDSRDKSVICVVEDTRDILAFKNSSYNGLYHVLGGKLDPLNGIGASSLNIESLLERIDDEVKEVILALNPDLSGETTTLYLSRLLSELGVKVSKIASGLPIGGNIEYADSATLIQSLEGRTTLIEKE